MQNVLNGGFIMATNGWPGLATVGGVAWVMLVAVNFIYIYWTNLLNIVQIENQSSHFLLLKPDILLTEFGF